MVLHHIHTEEVAIFELRIESQLSRPGFYLADAVLDIVETAAERELPYRTNTLWSWLEIKGCKRSPEVGASHESHFRIEVRTD